MPKPRTEINPIRAERVKIIIAREKKKQKITQEKIASMLYMSQQNLSRIVNLKNALTEENARRLIDCFPDYNLAWLLGDSDIMLKQDIQTDIIKKQDATNNAAITLLESALREVCLREKRRIPTLDNIPELLLLESQLRDYADALMWNYVIHRDNCHVWQYLDQIGSRI